MLVIQDGRKKWLPYFYHKQNVSLKYDRSSGIHCRCTNWLKIILTDKSDNSATSLKARTALKVNAVLTLSIYLGKLASLK